MVSFLTLVSARDILGLTSKTTNAKVDKWDNFKLKSSSQKTKPSTNEKVNMEWERIFANLISDESLISKM